MDIPGPNARPAHISFKSEKAIADYKKAMGRADGVAELSIFYCEEAFGFLESCSIEDEKLLCCSDPHVRTAHRIGIKAIPAHETHWRSGKISVATILRSQPLFCEAAADLNPAAAFVFLKSNRLCVPKTLY